MRRVESRNLTRRCTRTKWPLRAHFAGERRRYGASMPKVFALFLLLYSSAAVCCPETEQLSWLEAANPIADARSSFEAGDHKFRAVHSYTLMLPGLDANAEWSNKEAKNFLAIEGTSDHPCDPKLNWAATEYAKIYNLEILALLNGEQP